MAIRLEDIQLASSGNHLYPLIKATDATRLRVQSSGGYIDIGAGTSSSWGYILTDRANFYVDKGVHFDGNIQGYGGDETASFAKFIDSQNTAYYLDPANTGTAVNVAGEYTASVDHGDAGFIQTWRNTNTGTSAYVEHVIGNGSASELRVGHAPNYSSSDWNASWVYAVGKPLFLKSSSSYVAVYAGGAGASAEVAIFDTNLKTTLKGHIDVTNSGAVKIAGSDAINSSRNFFPNHTISFTYNPGSGGNTYLQTGTDSLAVKSTSGSSPATFFVDDGRVVHNFSTQSPIYYDKDDTTYYLNPASTSTSLKVAGGIITTAASGSILLEHQISEANAWLFQENAVNWGTFWFNNGSESGQTFGSYTTVGAEFVGFRNGTATNSINPSAWTGIDTSANATWLLSNYSGYIWSAGTQYSATDMRAPIFYDSDDTNYYCDPNGQSRLSTLNLGSSPTSGITAGYIAQIRGHIHMTNKDINYVSQLHFNDNLRFFDNGDDSYLTFKYGDTNAGGIRFRNGSDTQKGYVYADNSGFGLLDNDGAWAVRTQLGTDPLQLYCDGNNEFEVHTTYTYSPGSSRAPIFYDSNDTNYYLDPASTSNVNGLTVGGTLTFNGGNVEGYVSYTIDMSNTSTYAENTYYPVTIPIDSNKIYNFRIENALNSNVPGWSTHNSGFSLLLDYTTHGNGWGTHSQSRYLRLYSERFANVQILGGITQMSNSSTEVLWLRGGGKYYLKANKAGLTVTPRSSTHTVYSQSVSPTTSVVNDVYSAADGSGFAVQTMRLRDYIYHADDSDTYFGFNAADGWKLHVGGGDRLIASTSQLISNLNFQAPIFYDSNDTNYYIDPAGTSVLNALTTHGNNLLGNANGDYTHVNDTLYVGATDSGDSHFYFGENSSNWYGEHWYWDSGYETEKYSRHAGTDTLIEKHDTRYTHKIQTNRAYERLSHSTGYQIGSYNSVGGNSSNTNPIYTIGDNYRPTDTSLSGMYGIGYAHANLWGSGKTSGWGMYVVSNGGIDATIGDGDVTAWFASQVHAGGDFRAPVFYDYNNTGYYLDPASTSVVNKVVYNGRIEPDTPNDYKQTAITSLIEAPIFYPETNVVTTASYVPHTHARTRYSSGYRNHTSTGVYASASGWNYSYYIAMGGNDSYPTDAIYFDVYNNAISHSDGHVGFSQAIRATNFVDRENTSYSLTPNSTATGQWQVNTPSGYCTIGPANSSYSHFSTDRGRFYFNKELVVNSGTISSYDEDLRLRRTESNNDSILITTDSISFILDGAEDMRLQNTGDLQVEGDVIAYSTTVSDNRLKDDVVTIDNALDKVSKLRGVEYTWNNTSRKGQKDIGVIAQEVEEVIPEIVREKEMSLMDGKKYKTVDYEKLTAVLIEAVKQLKEEVEELKNKCNDCTK